MCNQGLLCISHHRYVHVQDEFEGVTSGQDELNLSPDREIGLNDQAMSVVNVNPLDVEGLQDESIDAHWKNSDFLGFDRGLNKDWSEGYKLDGETFLNSVSSSYYDTLKVGGYQQEVKTMTPNKPPTATPKNSKGFAQTFLVALTLHALKLEHDNPGSNKKANAVNSNVFAQGNPGVWQNFYTNDSFECCSYC